MGGRSGRRTHPSTIPDDLRRDAGRGVVAGRRAPEVRFVDAETYARIIRWQNDPLYNKVPYEALYEGGDPEEVAVEIRPGHQLDPDFDELVTEVKQRSDAQYRTPRVKRTRRGFSIGTLTVRADRHHRVAVPVQQDREYRSHVRRLNRVSEKHGSGRVLAELRIAITPSRWGEMPLEAHPRFYSYDAKLRPPYFQRLVRYIRGLDRPKRERAERVIARLTTHPDRCGQRNARASDPRIGAAIQKDAAKVRRAVAAFIRQRNSSDKSAARTTLGQLCSELPQDLAIQAVDRFALSGGPPWSYRPVDLTLWVLSKTHRVGQKRVQALIARPSSRKQ